MESGSKNRVIFLEVIIDSTIDAAWDAWTTEDGIRSFFAPDCMIDLQVGGAYEILFNPNARPGERGGEGVTILAIQPKKMLAFTWNAPTYMPEVRKQFTHVVVRFDEAASQRTKITITHDGWGEGEEWDQAYQYFVRAWKDFVLPRLEYRFSVGSVNWDDPPDIG